MAESVIIVGGGIVGLSSAYYLKKAGCDVTIIDKEDFKDNCSYGNAGMIVPSHFTPMAAPGMISQGIKWMFDSKSPFYVKPSLSWSLISWGLKFMKHATASHVEHSAPYLRDLNLYSSQLYSQLALDLENSFDLKNKGILMLYKTEATQEEEIHLAHKAQELGLDVEILSKEQVQTLEPNAKLEVLGAVHYKCDAHLYPPALMNALLENLKRAGVKFLPNEELVNVNTAGSEIKNIETSSGKTLSAGKYIFASGARLQETAKLVGLNVPIMPGKGYSFLTSDFNGNVEHPSLLLEARVALTPMGGKVRIGGTMELAAINHKINMNRVEGIVSSIPKYYPQYNIDIPSEDKIWHGFRPCSPDGLPYLGESKKLKNLIVAGGLGMMGLSLGPAVGKTVADLVTGNTPSLKTNIYNPERFN